MKKIGMTFILTIFIFLFIGSSKKELFQSIKSPLPSTDKIKSQQLTSPEIDPLEVAEVLSVTHLLEDIKSLDSILEDRLNQAREKLTPEDYHELEKVVVENFSGDKFSDEIKIYLSKKFTLEDFENLKKITRDPFMQKVWEMQAKYSEEEDQIKGFLRDFLPTPERQSLIRELEGRANFAEKVLDLNQEFLKGMLKGSYADKFDFDQINFLTARFREKIKPEIDQEVLTQYYYNYQDLSDEELKDLIGYNENNILRKTEELVHQKLKELLYAGGMKLGRLGKGYQD